MIVICVQLRVNARSCVIKTNELKSSVSSVLTGVTAFTVTIPLSLDMWEHLHSYVQLTGKRDGFDNEEWKIKDFQIF